MPEPGIAAVVGNPRDYRDAHPTAAALVVEVADTTLQFDRVEKASMYAGAGVRDYWVLNLVERVLEVYRDPESRAGSPFGYAYRRALRLGPDDRLAPLAALSGPISVADLLP